MNHCRFCQFRIGEQCSVKGVRVELTTICDVEPAILRQHMLKAYREGCLTLCTLLE